MELIKFGLYKNLFLYLSILFIILFLFNFLISKNDVVGKKILNDFDYKIDQDEKLIDKSQKNDQEYSGIFKSEKIDEPEYSQNRIIISLKGNAFKFPEGKNSLSIQESKNILPDSINKLNSKYGVINLKKIVPEKSKLTSLKNTYVLDISKKQNIKFIINEYRKDPNIENVELEPIYRFTFVPNDPLFGKMWDLDNAEQDYYGFWEPESTILDADIDFPESSAYGSYGIVVAVLDTGVDYNHEDITQNMWINKNEIPNNDVDDDNNGYVDDIYGYDFISRVSDPLDYGFSPAGHGTHIAGTIAAVQNNQIGMPGICKNCKIMALKIFPSLPVSAIIEAISYAVDNGANVISMSIGGFAFSQNFQNAINDAYLNNLVIVAGAGNDASKTDNFYPCSFDNVLCVAATNNKDKKAWFSNYGDGVDLSAPGVDIYSLRAKDTDMYWQSKNPSDPIRFKHVINEYGQQNDNGKYYIATGTSMATPHVSGLVGAIWGIYPNLKNSEIETIVKTYVDKIDDINQKYKGKIGTGRINVKYSLEKNLPKHDVYIASDIPKVIKINNLLNLSVSVGNNGVYIENKTLDFYFNKKFITSKKIKQLYPQQSLNTKFNIYLEDLFYQNISFYIDTKDEEYLANNIINEKLWVYNEEGFKINQDNSIFDCKTNQNPKNQPIDKIVGPLKGNGIEINGKNNIVIKNCEISGFDKGISIQSSLNNDISYNKLNNNKYSGIYLDSSLNNIILSNSIILSGGGITLLSGSSKNLVLDNIVSKNYNGISLGFSSDNNFISKNKACLNEKLDFHCFNSISSYGSMNYFTFVQQCSDGWPVLNKDYGFC